MLDERCLFHRRQKGSRRDDVSLLNLRENLPVPFCVELFQAASAAQEITRFLKQGPERTADPIEDGPDQARPEGDRERLAQPDDKLPGLKALSLLKNLKDPFVSLQAYDLSQKAQRPDLHHFPHGEGRQSLGTDHGTVDGDDSALFFHGIAPQ